MKIGLLLIALGFGYQIFADAYRQKLKPLERLGKAVGAVIMLVSFFGILCFLFPGFKLFCDQKGYCPFAAKGGKAMCGFSSPKHLPTTGNVSDSE